MLLLILRTKFDNKGNETQLCFSGFTNHILLLQFIKARERKLFMEKQTTSFALTTNCITKNPKKSLPQTFSNVLYQNLKKTDQTTTRYSNTSRNITTIANKFLKTVSPSGIELGYLPFGAWYSNQ